MTGSARAERQSRPPPVSVFYGSIVMFILIIVFLTIQLSY